LADYTEGGVINYLDLFSGIGGFHKGLINVGFHFDWCGFSEIDKYARQIYQKHFSESEDLGDVRTITVDRLPQIDFITFGFPCQDVSIAGKRGGITASRSCLFFEAMRIIRATRPRYFIFENVKGLFSSNEGRDWLAVLREVADSGYDGQWQLLNTRWVLPQNRERIFFVGHIRGQGRPEIFPIGEGITEVPKKGNGKDIAGCLNTKNQSGQAQFDGSTTLIAVNNNRGNLSESDVINNLDRNYHKGMDNYGQRTLIQVGTKRGRDVDGQRIYDENGIYSALKGIGEPNLIQSQNRIRRLTPLECERLQGFPENWTDSVSDSQKYKCLGNSVTVPIIELIGKKLKELL